MYRDGLLRLAAVAGVVRGGEGAHDSVVAGSVPRDGFYLCGNACASAVVLCWRSFEHQPLRALNVVVFRDDHLGRSGVHHVDGLLCLAAVSSVVRGSKRAHDGVVAFSVPRDGFACHLDRNLSAIVRRRSVVKEQFYGAL